MEIQKDKMAEKEKPSKQATDIVEFVKNNLQCMLCGSLELDTIVSCMTCCNSLVCKECTNNWLRDQTCPHCYANIYMTNCLMRVRALDFVIKKLTG